MNPFCYCSQELILKIRVYSFKVKAPLTSGAYQLYLYSMNNINNSIAGFPQPEHIRAQNQTLGVVTEIMCITPKGWKAIEQMQK